MPGPVDSPSSDAIEASGKPDKSSTCTLAANVEDGKSILCNEQEEHDQNVARAYQ